MSKPEKKPKPKPTPTYEPSRKDRLRPAELLGLSGVLAVFVGIIVILTTHQLLLSAICLVLAFIGALVVLAMLSLSFKPNDEEIADLHEQNHPGKDADGH